MTKALTNTRPIRLKGRSFLAIVLSPELPFDDWLARLDDLSARSTGFFLGRPVVLDVEGLDVDRDQLKDLIGELGERSVRIMGIEGAKPSLLGLGMPPAMKGGRAAPDFEAESKAEAEANPEAGDGAEAVCIATAKQSESASRSEAQVGRIMPSLLIDEPVRSGQSVIYPEGDVTIVGSVASGAEIVAGGSIHVYGTLRGRALAGSVGNASARIFCRKLEAELLAIDGLYKTAEDMEPKLRGQAVQLWLDGNTIMAQKLG